VNAADWLTKYRDSHDMAKGNFAISCVPRALRLAHPAPPAWRDSLPLTAGKGFRAQVKKFLA